MFFLITYFNNSNETFRNFKSERAAMKEGDAAIKRGASRVIVHCGSDWEWIRTPESKWELFEN